MSRARDLADGTFSGAFSADSPTFVVDDANNRVGIGTTSPSRNLQIGDNTDSAAIISLQTTTSGKGSIYFGDNTATSAEYAGVVRYDHADNSMQFWTSSTPRARFDSSGNLLVGKTSSGGANTGAELRPLGDSWFTRGSGAALNVNRTSSDGDIAVFYKDTTTVGSIGSQGGELWIGYLDVGVKFHAGLDAIMPWDPSTNNYRDNAISLGRPTSYRFDDAYIVNGVTTGSDGNEKQDIAELDEAEKRVALAAKSLVRKYRWIDSVEKKGDDARIHVGVIAQDLKAAFEAEGLDAHRYGMFMSNTYWVADEILPAVEEVLDEAGNVVTEAQPERTVQRVYEGDQEVPEGATEHVRLGVRYPELLAFIIGAM